MRLKTLAVIGIAGGLELEAVVLPLFAALKMPPAAHASIAARENSTIACG
jgi:hypothetical protein